MSVLTLKKRSGFFDSQEAVDIKEKLQYMVTSGLYNTVSGYTANGELYPDHLMPFVDKHMNYLHANPKLDAEMYLTNLRLKTRIR